MLESDRTMRILGPVLLFSALFLPGYVYQNPQTATAVLTQTPLLLQNIALGLPQALLVLYIILTRGHTTKQAAGIVPFRAADIAKIAAGTAGLVIIALPGAFINAGLSEPILNPVAPTEGSPWVILLYVPVCLVTGYREELFFRSYLLTELDPFGRKSAVAVASLLFAAGHIYQGIGAFAVTAFIGLFLAWLFLRTRSIHIVAISHAVYNFLILTTGVVL